MATAAAITMATTVTGASLARKPLKHLIDHAISVKGMMSLQRRQQEVASIRKAISFIVMSSTIARMMRSPATIRLLRGSSPTVRSILEVREVTRILRLRTLAIHLQYYLRDHNRLPRTSRPDQGSWKMKEGYQGLVISHIAMCRLSNPATMYP